MDLRRRLCSRAGQDLGRYITKHFTVLFRIPNIQETIGYEYKFYKRLYVMYTNSVRDYKLESKRLFSYLGSGEPVP